jgi:hypothetical protein
MPHVNCISELLISIITVYFQVTITNLNNFGINYSETLNRVIINAGGIMTCAILTTRDCDTRDFDSAGL